MKSNRITPLTPLISSLAILSFKKKSKGGGDLGGLSTSMDDLNLDGENLSLSDLGGSVGSLSKLEKKDKKDRDGGLDDSLLAGLTTSGPRMDDKKFMEIEASVNDLKKHAESADLSSKSTKGEIESMKNDLSQINANIKSLLNVYEAVSRQYNPFVDNSMPAKAPADEEPVEEDADLGDISLGSLSSLGSLDSLSDKKIEELKADPPEDDLGPLDRIVRPDDEEEEELEALPELNLASLAKPKAPMLEEEPEEEPVPGPVAAPMPKPKPRAVIPVDVYALEQFHKLVEYQLSKIYRTRIVGNEPDPEDMEALDRWMSEFKRIGGG